MNETYRIFKNDNIEYSSNRIGEARLMNCGMIATIIAYRRSDDIDIRFEDGLIIKSRKYSDFKNRSVAKPNIRIGERKSMNNGMAAEIIAYRSAKDIDIRFEDDTIVINTSYQQFQNGCIANTHIGEKKTNE